MGFIRSNTVKGNEYIYYCERKRSHKKSGGTGKVQSYEICLGSSKGWGKSLGWFVFSEQIELESFLNAFLAFIKPHLKDNYELKIKKDKGRIISATIKLSGKHEFDARSKHFRDLKNDINNELKTVLNIVTDFYNEVDRLTLFDYFLSQEKESLKEEQDELSALTRAVGTAIKEIENINNQLVKLELKEKYINLNFIHYLIESILSNPNYEIQENNLDILEGNIDTYHENINTATSEIQEIEDSLLSQVPRKDKNKAIATIWSVVNTNKKKLAYISQIKGYDELFSS